jgi:hypothetical protein
MKISKKIDDRVYRQVSDQVSWDVRVQVVNQVRHQLWDQISWRVWRQVRNQVREMKNEN